ncbi:MAG: competence/damage-inducible protein A [Roseburia sp.]|nr:competence/damage-inducible protein A [Roseburia sp.]MCM1097170.1 competence/damage-inducible protein A [Ruminococcus flavefaciens]
MTVELICVGTELLLGNIVNTNAAYLAEKCAGLGLSCYFQTVVGDNEERLALVLRTALERSEIIILSGGLGPTEDDLTKETVAKVCGRKLVLHEPSREAILDFFAARGAEPTDNNWKQAMLPEGCIVVENRNGTAPGVILETEEAKVILLPGPPEELCPMFEDSVMPYLAGLTSQVICSQTVKICGVGESRAEAMMKDLIDAQTNPTLATYAKIGEVHIRVTAGAENRKAAMKLIKPTVKELKNRFGNDIYTTEEDVTLERAVVELLQANKLTITCGESCTGGLLSARLINVPGVSDTYKTGVITYSNKAKRRLLGVKKSTLQKYGAVSEQTATEMAKGLVVMTKADVAVAVTGLAGPDGGTEEKPVGLVYIACNVKGKITVKKYRFSGNRNTVRESAVSAALALLRSCILEYFSKVTFGKKE